MSTSKCQEELLGLYFSLLKDSIPPNHLVQDGCLGPCVYSRGGMKDHEKSNGRSAFKTSVPDVAQTTFTCVLLA